MVGPIYAGRCAFKHVRKQQQITAVKKGLEGELKLVILSNAEFWLNVSHVEYRRTLGWHDVYVEWIAAGLVVQT